MIAIRLKHTSINISVDQLYLYRVAQEDLVMDVSLNPLSEFVQTTSNAVSGLKLDGKAIDTTRVRQLYQGPGWIGKKWREVQAWSVATGYEIDVVGVGVFWIANDGDAIVLIKKAGGVSIDVLVEALLGPALILALAIHGIYCLHGSAVLLDERAVLFLGESGKGKSTLAHWLKAQEDEMWRLISDDIVPVRLSGGKLVMLPHFPQLKLPVDAQPSRDLPEQLPLKTLYVLDRPRDSISVKVCALDSQEASLLLVRHTVASRLFDQDLLVKHLDFCMLMAALIPVRKLVYPLDYSALPAVWETLQAQKTSGLVL